MFANGFREFFTRFRFKKPLLGIGLLTILILFTIVTPIILIYLKQTAIIFNLISFIISFILSGLAILYWRHFKLEQKFLDSIIFENNLVANNTPLNTDSNEFLGIGVTLTKKLTVDSKISIPEDATGNNYLNAFLMARYRPELRRMLRNRLLFILSTGLISLIGIAFINNRFIKIDEKYLTSVYGILFFVFYLASLGKPLVQMFFVNCDSAMLYYPFYRQRKNIIDGFFYRFKKIISLNSIITGCIFLISLCLVLIIKISALFYLVLALELLGITLFFSFHELFIYYLIQPFTSDLMVVNPLYKIINIVMFFISYAFSKGSLSGYNYAIIIGVVTLFYVIIGTVVIYYLAPKTFRIRQ